MRVNVPIETYRYLKSTSDIKVHVDFQLTYIEGTEDQIKELVRDLIYKHIVRIRFLKSNGHERTLLCTKIPSIFSESFQKEEVAQPVQPSSGTIQYSIDRKVNPEPDHIIRVYDVESEGWKSIIVGNIRELSIPQGYYK